MWDFVVTWVWYVLPVVAGIISFVKGRHLWALTGLLPLSVGITVAAIEDSLGRPEWLSTIGGFALYAVLPSPLAIIGAVQPARDGSLLDRWRQRPVDPGKPSWRHQITGFGSVFTGALVIGLSALVAVLVVSITGLVEQSRYEAALTAEPVGETAVTDFQFSPNFNTGEVWTVSGIVSFGVDYAEVSPWVPGKPLPPLPTHPGIDHGPEGGPAVAPRYGIRLYFHNPHGLQGDQAIRVTCRIKGHEDEDFLTYRVLDACRDLRNG